jgi:hypothetical protein
MPLQNIGISTRDLLGPSSADRCRLIGFNHPQHFAQAGFFFSEPANHVNKDPLLSDSVDVIPGRSTRIRVDPTRTRLLPNRADPLPSLIC